LWEIVVVLKNFSRNVSTSFPAVLSFLQGGGKLSVNQIQLLIYVFLKRWLINWIPQPGPYVNEITITKLSEDVYLCMIAC